MAEILKVGQRVRIPNGADAYIRYIGTTEFKEGEWVGLELDEPIGKNNGTVEGIEYFNCTENHGMFMRPLSTIQVLQQAETRSESEPEPEPTSQSPVRTPNRPPVSSSRQSTAPTPSTRNNGAVTVRVSSANPTKGRPSLAPTTAKRNLLKIAPKSGASATISATTRRVSNASPAPSGTTLRSSRLSLAGRSSSPKKPIATQSVAIRTSVVSSRPGIKSPGHGSSRSSTGIDRVLSHTSAPCETRPASQRGSLVVVPTTGSVAQKKYNDELEAKANPLEKKRTEDQDSSQKISNLMEEQSHYLGVIEKLQTKCQNLGRDNNELKREARGMNDRMMELDTLQAEHDSILELAQLDREMAEERAESFENELEGLRGRMEELELENDILKEENEELGKEMSPEDRSSQTYLQMQREIHRLRQALLKLRDFSREQEDQAKDEIKHLTRDLAELSDAREKFESSQAELLAAQADNEDLREQLDAALSAETIIEQLTERNLQQSEQMDELRRTVVHLQDLKDINDELEDNHVEHERQLQQVIDFKDSLISETNKRLGKQQDELMDREYSIARFRKLAATLESDLDDMRASKQISDIETQNLERSGRAVMDLNRQLQASATSATIKTIDVELCNLEVSQASEQLAIVQLFLPEAFNTGRDGILAYLRFKRIIFKAKLLHDLVKQRIGESEAVFHDVDVFTICDILDELLWLAAMSNRFVAEIEASNLDRFAQFETTLHEADPVERALNVCLESLKTDILQEHQVMDGLQRSFAVMKHLAELHLPESSGSFTEEILMRALIIQGQMKSAALVLALIKADVLRTTLQAVDADEEDMMQFRNGSESTSYALTSAKVIAGKLHEIIHDMKLRNLALKSENLARFEECNQLAKSVAEFFRSVGKTISQLLHMDDQPTPLTWDMISNKMREISLEFFGVADSDVFSSVQTKTRCLAECLSELSNMVADLNQLVEFEKLSAPWILRCKELQDRKEISAVAEEEIVVLKRELQERVTMLKTRQQQTEELNMRIELLEARNQEANKKVQQLAKLEHELVLYRHRTSKMENQLLEQTEAVERMEEERDEWLRKAAAIESTKGRCDGKAGDQMIGSAREMNDLGKQLKLLQDTNQHLRQQFRARQTAEDTKHNSWLLKPLQRSHKVSERAADLKAVLDNIAILPCHVNSYHTAINDWSRAKQQEKAEAQAHEESVMVRPRNKSSRLLLFEEEEKWLSTWGPVSAYWKGVPDILGTAVVVD